LARWTPHPPAPEEAGDVADETGPGAVAAGDAGAAPEHADRARITIAAAAGAVCRERISASVPSIAPRPSGV
jgi:hypothetical protein